MSTSLLPPGREASIVSESLAGGDEELSKGKVEVEGEVEVVKVVEVEEVWLERGGNEKVSLDD